ncbi:25028_t:CDS:2, partial [Cetraspora pellucida]
MDGETYFDFAKRKKLLFNLYHFYLFNALTNRIDLKKNVDQIVKELNTQFFTKQRKSSKKVSYSPKHQALIDFIEAAQKRHLYVPYGVYLETCAKELGWFEVLSRSLYEPLDLIESKTRILNLSSMKEVNET